MNERRTHKNKECVYVLIMCLYFLLIVLLESGCEPWPSVGVLEYEVGAFGVLVFAILFKLGTIRV